MIVVKFVSNFWSYKGKQYICVLCKANCKDVHVYYKEILKNNKCVSQSISTVCIACSLSRTKDEIERTI